MPDPEAMEIIKGLRPDPTPGTGPSPSLPPITSTSSPTPGLISATHGLTTSAPTLISPNHGLTAVPSSTSLALTSVTNAFLGAGLGGPGSSGMGLPGMSSPEARLSAFTTIHPGMAPRPPMDFKTPSALEVSGQ